MIRTGASLYAEPADTLVVQIKHDTAADCKDIEFSVIDVYHSFCTLIKKQLEDKTSERVDSENDSEVVSHGKSHIQNSRHMLYSNSFYPNGRRTHYRHKF